MHEVTYSYGQNVRTFSYNCSQLNLALVTFLLLELLSCGLLRAERFAVNTVDFLVSPW